MRTRAVALIISLTALVAAATLAAVPAGAGARTTVIVRNGFWGQNNFDPGYNGIYFRTRNRRVFDFHAMVTLDCRNADTGETTHPAFDVRLSVPVFTVPSSGTETIQFSEESDLRTALVTLRVRFTGNRSRTTVKVVGPPVTDNLREQCNGQHIFSAQRSSNPNT